MANLWKQFEKLLPQKKQFIGQVTDIDVEAKMCTMTMLGGQSIFVKGDNAVINNYYLVEDGVISREVPGLTSYNITIY